MRSEFKLFSSKNMACVAMSLLLCIGLNIPTFAASFGLDEFGQMTLQGDIRLGDADRAIAILLSIKPIAADIYVYPQSLQVNSRGGDVGEALKIGALVRALYMNVNVAPADAGVCASSCFFIYLAGVERGASGLDRLTSEGKPGNFGPIGLHRPYFTVPDGGPKSSQRQEEMMLTTATLLRAQHVPQFLIDKMMSYASNDIYWLNTEEIRSIGRFQAGVEEELISKCGYNAKREDKLSAAGSMRDIASGTRACMGRHLQNFYGPSKKAAIERLKKGWRPWSN